MYAWLPIWGVLYWQVIDQRSIYKASTMSISHLWVMITNIFPLMRNYLSLGRYPLCFCFGVAQAFKRRLCSGKICYFSVFLHPTILRLWGSTMLQGGDHAREICYFVVVHASSFPLQPVRIIYFSFPAYLLWP